MWRPDVLGDGWSARTLTLRPDARGEVVATLVRRDHAGPPRARAVLYLHGYVDYFFQRHLGDFWDARGFDFYALDLRGHGRSLLDHQVPNDVAALATYAEELDAAVRLLREAGYEVVVLNAHSTGGLVGALWLDARAGRATGAVVDAAVLNSPWFDLNRPWVDRVVTTRAVDVLGRVAPLTVVGQTGRHYGEWLHSPAGGGWSYDLGWKPDAGFGVRAGWFRAIRRGHRALARGLAIDVPVLVCASDASGPADRWHDALDRTDSVLDVRHILAGAPRLGPDVTVVQVPGGVHDLVLSPEPARTDYLDAVAAWVAERVPGAAG